MASTPSHQRRILLPRPASPLQAAVAVAVAAGFITFLAVAANHHRSEVPAPVTRKPITSAVSPAQLEMLSASLGQPIYWVGPRPGVTYELTRSGTEVVLRYLPPGVRVGARRPFLTVGTYRLANAFAATRSLTKQLGQASRTVADGGVAVYSLATPTDIHIAYPGLGYQLEVFSPDAAEARRLVTDGMLRPVPAAPAAPILKPGIPTAVSIAGLRALSISLGQPIYWIGPRAGVTYELTQKGDQLFLRYVPRRLAIGTPESELTVGTYRIPDAYAVTFTAAAQPDAKRVGARTGGVAFYRPSRPQSVYLAPPGRGVQLEVYDPDASTALRLATSDQLRPVR